MGGIPRVLLALQPVTIDGIDGDLANGVGPDEEVPAWQGGGRQRAHIGEDEPAQLLDRISLHLAGEAGGGLHGPLRAGAGLVVEPAMIWAAQPAIVGNAILQVHQPMQAAVADEPQCATAVLVEHQILAEDAHLAHGIFQQLRKRGYGNPVAPHQVAAGRAWPNAGEALIHLRRDHRCSFLRVTPLEYRSASHRSL